MTAGVCLWPFGQNDSLWSVGLGWYENVSYLSVVAVGIFWGFGRLTFGVFAGSLSG